MLGLFGRKKKSSDVSTLSEKDIQAKLYGEFRKEDLETKESPFSNPNQEDQSAVAEESVQGPQVAMPEFDLTEDAPEQAEQEPSEVEESSLPQPEQNEESQSEFHQPLSENSDSSDSNEEEDEGEEDEAAEDVNSGFGYEQEVETEESVETPLEGSEESFESYDDEQGEEEAPDSEGVETPVGESQADTYQTPVPTDLFEGRENESSEEQEATPTAEESNDSAEIHELPKAASKLEFLNKPEWQDTQVEDEEDDFGQEPLEGEEELFEETEKPEGLDAPPIERTEPSNSPGDTGWRFYSPPKKKNWNIDWSRYKEGVVNVFSVLVDLIRRVVSLVDFRREYVRQTVYWAAGFGILILLLVGIHSLNVERENAIKNTQGGKAAAPASSEQSTDVVSRNENPLSKEEAEVATVAAVQAEPAPQTPAASTTPPPASEGRFVIQIATYAGETNANRIMNDLKKDGWSAFVKGLSRSGGRVYYSVFIGRFETYKDAQQEIARFQKSKESKSFKDAFIRTLK